MKLFLKFSVAACAALVSHLPLSATPFEQGSNAFREGKFKEAVAHFEEALASGHKSAGLYFNLGLAQKRDKDPAMASLNLRRALMLDPLLVDARMELSDLERSQGIPFAPVDWKVNLAEHVPLLPLLITGFAVFWLGAFWLLYLVFVKNRRALPVATGLLCCVFGGALFFAAYSADPRFLWRSAAVAMAPSGLLTAPAERSESAARLPAGSMVHVLRTTGNWSHCSVPDGTKGWVPSEILTTLVPPA